MKPLRNLWPSIANFQNLLIAAKKAQKGKRFALNVARFNLALESHLFQLLEQLETGQYRPGPYQSFYIFEPKPRMISAAPYRDRVVHHALCNIIGPLLEKALISDTYANRTGLGNHVAAERYCHFARRYPFVLKCDIRKFFPSIDHQILKKVLRRKIGCKRTLWLIDLIIDNSNPQEEHIVHFPGDSLFTPLERRRGLPIGNLTSQLWGNFYLSPLDHFVKETLRRKAYIRYVDDFVVFGNSAQELAEVKRAIEQFLQEYRLILHERKSRVFRTADGVTFLGFRIFPDFTLLPSANVRRFRRRTRKRIHAYFAGKISLRQFIQSLKGWEGHALRANTHRLRLRLRKEIFGK